MDSIHYIYMVHLLRQRFFLFVLYQLLFGYEVGGKVPSTTDDQVCTVQGVVGNGCSGSQSNRPDSKHVFVFCMSDGQTMLFFTKLCIRFLTLAMAIQRSEYGRLTESTKVQCTTLYGVVTP